MEPEEEQPPASGEEAQKEASPTEPTQPTETPDTPEPAAAEEEEEAEAGSGSEGSGEPGEPGEQGASEAAAPGDEEGKQAASNESENESEELDDIELIFTTEETCRELGLQEDLVSISDTETWQQQQHQQQHQQHQRRTPTLAEQRESSPRTGQGKSPEGAEAAPTQCNGAAAAASAASPAAAATCAAVQEKSASVEEAANSSQSSSIDREESVDRFDESSSGRLNKMWSQCSVLVETDISKCGVLEEADLSARHAARRNTLAAPPTAYRPIIHREALAAGRRKSSAPLRPVMDRAEGMNGGARRESGAQTDISALPAQWRSESYLAHKVAHTFTTLPSKFALPAGVPGRLRLSDKTREARRVMLSDISFTSMVPELSRSADHLCQEPNNQIAQPQNYSSRSGGIGGLRTPESNRREAWVRGGLPSPCDCRLSADLYSSGAAGRYRGSLTSIPSPGAGDLGPSRRHSWRPNAAASFDGWRTPAVAHVGSGASLQTVAHAPRLTWSSMPSSPTHVQPPSSALVARLAGRPPRRNKSKVTFQDCPMIRGSLPNLRTELLAENSGDSTESLLDEAEDYLRHSIDSMLTFPGSAAECCNARHSAASGRRRRARRHSEPDLFREWNPPRDARPYLPKIPQDLKLDHLVKVISAEGRILQGRVRYVGSVAGREDVQVGVELPCTCDGTFHGRRYFDCDSERMLFVPFKKVVLAWCTT